MIGLAVGLGVGLGMKKKSGTSSSTDNTPNPTVILSTSAPILQPSLNTAGEVVGVTDIALSPGASTTYPFQYTIPTQATGVTNGKIIYTETVAINNGASMSTLLVPLTVTGSEIVGFSSVLPAVEPSATGTLGVPSATSTGADVAANGRRRRSKREVVFRN